MRNYRRNLAKGKTKILQKFWMNFASYKNNSVAMILHEKKSEK